jgi:hypothetical protein
LNFAECLRRSLTHSAVRSGRTGRPATRRRPCQEPTAITSDHKGMCRLSKYVTIMVGASGTQSPRTPLPLPSLSLSLSRSRSLALTLSLSLSRSRSLICALTLLLSRSRSLARSCSRSLVQKRHTVEAPVELEYVPAMQAVHVVAPVRRRIF